MGGGWGSRKNGQSFRIMPVKFRTATYAPQKKLVENVLIASQQNLLQACVAEWPPKPFTHPVFLIHSHILFRDYGVGRSEETETLGHPGCFSLNRLTSEAPSHVKLVKKIDFCSGDLGPGAWAPIAWEKYAKGNRHFLRLARTLKHCFLAQTNTWTSSISERSRRRFKSIQSDNSSRTGIGPCKNTGSQRPSKAHTGDSKVAKYGYIKISLGFRVEGLGWIEMVCRESVGLWVLPKAGSPVIAPIRSSCSFGLPLLNQETLNPTTLNPKTLNPKTLNPTRRSVLVELLQSLRHWHLYHGLGALPHELSEFSGCQTLAWPFPKQNAEANPKLQFRCHHNSGIPRKTHLTVH